MALIELNYFSSALMRTVPVNVILPSDKTDFEGNRISRPPYKTLYLLHGIFGNYTDWVTGTRIARWAVDHDLAVVMPSGDNRFYVNHAGGAENYGDWISKELVDITREMFPLSKKREDTFIGGLSMGGYGALVNGLAHPETFGGIAAFSSAIMPDHVLARSQEYSANLLEQKAFNEACLGISLDQLENSDRNLHTHAKKAAMSPYSQRIFLACGTEDFLYDLNVSFKKELEDLKMDVAWSEFPGGHEWDFWDQAIFQAIEWISPASIQGASSGNVQSGD